MVKTFSKSDKVFSEGQLLGIVYTCAWKLNEPKTTKSTVIEFDNFDSWIKSNQAKYDYFKIDYKVSGYNKEKIREQIDPLRDKFNALNKALKFSKTEYNSVDGSITVYCEIK